tara:strand:- start:20769 stop:23282 length:2514 start_codon:yes stop_codon:yes gene_type:complete
MSGLGSFLEGVMQGAQVRRSWDRQDRAEKREVEDRTRRQEHDQWARSRTDRLDEQNAEDRRRRRSTEDSNAEWLEIQRDRQRDAYEREDAERQAYKDSYAATLEAEETGETAPAPAGTSAQPAPTPASGRQLRFPNTDPSQTTGPVLRMPSVQGNPIVPPQMPPEPSVPQQPDLMAELPERVVPAAYVPPTPPAAPAPSTSSAPAVGGPTSPAPPPVDDAPVAPRARQVSRPDTVAPTPLPALPERDDSGRGSRRFQDAIAQIGSSTVTPQLAMEADRAEAALMAGVNPQTGQALNAYEQRQLQGVVDAATMQLRRENPNALPDNTGPAVSAGNIEMARTQETASGQAQYAAGQGRRLPSVRPAQAGPDMQRPSQPSAPGPRNDTAPQSQSAATRFTAYAAQNPDRFDFGQARSAEIAAKALQTGINPQTNQPLSPEDRRLAQRVVSRANEKLVRLQQEDREPTAPASAPRVPLGHSPRMMPPRQAPKPPSAAPDAPQPSAAPAGVSPAAPQQPAAPAAPQGAAMAAGTTAGPTPAQAAATGAPDALNAAVDQAAQSPAPPSVEAAAEVVTRGRTLPLATAPKAELKRRGARATEDIMSRYAKVGAPKMVEFYLAAGEPEKAAAFQTFIQQSETKKAMSSWADAVFAASIGNDDMFLDSLTEAYNARGYFDDGYEAVRKQSGILRDAGGNITGAQITFKDTKSGRVFTQQLDSSEDLYQMGVSMLAPEQVFEHGWTRIKATEDRRAALLDLARKEQLKVTATDEKRINDAIELLGKQDIGFTQLPIDEQVAHAWAYVQRFSSNGQYRGNVPVSPPAGQPANNPASQQVGADRVVPRY